MGMSSLPLLIALVGATYISRKCFHRPNPPPARRHGKDQLIELGQSLPDLREYAFLVAALGHIMMAVTYPAPPRLVCPLPRNLNKEYFTWSPQLIFLLAIIYSAGILRIAAFRQLGSNFTFELANPKRLVKTGLYKYVQHPSYPGDGLLTITNFALFMNLDGWPGCFLPARIIKTWLSLRLLGIVVAAVLYMIGITVRIRNEEEMLKDAFGKEWEDYHRNTARFIPGVF